MKTVSVRHLADLAAAVPGGEVVDLHRTFVVSTGRVTCGVPMLGEASRERA